MGLAHTRRNSSWRPFRRLSQYLYERHGERVFKVSVHGDFNCPNRDGTTGWDGCAFCSKEAVDPLGYEPGRSVSDQLRAGMSYVHQRHGTRRFIAYYQDYSATYAPVERLAALYEPALRTEEVVGLAVSTRPDCLPAPVLALLGAVSSCKDLWVELGLQIAHDGLLASINRGHTVADFARAVAVCHAHGLPVCAHVIIGLPGASRRIERQTADLLAELGIWGVKLHAFHVLRGTVMAERHAAGELRLLEREEHADRVVEFLERMPPEVVVHRVTAESPRRCTVAPTWTVNKMRAYDAVLDAFSRGETWQGRLFASSPQSSSAAQLGSARTLSIR